MISTLLQLLCKVHMIFGDESLNCALYCTYMLYVNCFGMHILNGSVRSKLNTISKYI